MSKKEKADKKKEEDLKNIANSKENIDDNVEEVSKEENNELEELAKKNAELTDKLQRNLAEFDNFRKRTQREKASMYDDGVRDTVEKILPMIDNFERALSSIQNKEDSIYKGLSMVYSQFEQTLKDVGVEAIICVGEQFDPNLHFAVSHENMEEYGENEIIDELQKGYKYKDKVIRHSMVKVAN